MTNAVELTKQEKSIIESALNAYWNDAHDQVVNNKAVSYDGNKRLLGTIEKQLLEQRMTLVLPLLRKFENLH